MSPSPYMPEGNRVAELERALRDLIDATETLDIHQLDEEALAPVVMAAREALRPNHYVMPPMRIK